MRGPAFSRVQCSEASDRRAAIVDNTNPDFVMLAKAYGFEAFHCDTESDLPDACARLFAAPGPSFCEFRVHPDICLPMVVRGWLCLIMRGSVSAK